ncbi:MAG: Gfo/Idh/MocA family oxidoreductase [Chloroflexi bacterium]|nr:Gfo/Idh/MocA family oxidoreductase [Chloroflexota bacterium]
MINVAVVGYGYWGPNLVRNFFQLDSCNLVLCCDLDPQRLALAKKLYPTAGMTTSFQEVLESKEVDAIAIATPVRSHFSLVSQALQSGKHVLVEKPLAANSNEAQQLVRLADAQGRVLMVGHTFLYNPALHKVKDLCRQDYLGDMLYLYSHRVNLGRIQTDINALWSIAPHDISIALHLVGEFPYEVSAHGASYLTKGLEDVVFLTLFFPSGIIGHIHVSWIDPSKVRKVTVVGSQRMIVYDDVADEGKVKVYDKGVWKIPDDKAPQFGEFHYRLHSGDIFEPKIDMVEPLAIECAHFIECIREGKRPITDGVNGLEVVQVLEAANTSLERHGAPVKVGGQLAVV